MRSRGGTIASTGMLLALLLMSAPARAANVTVEFRLAVERPGVHISSCVVSVPSGSNAISVLNAAQRHKACRLLHYRLGYDSSRNKQYAACIDYICSVYNSFWYQLENGQRPGLRDEFPGSYVEDFSAQQSDRLTYAYYTQACVYTVGSYACL